MFLYFLSLGIFAGVTLTGIGSTLLLDETMNQSLERLSREDQREFIRGTPGFRYISYSVDHLTGVPPIELRHGVIHQRGYP
jgi:hypothetical protein